MQANPQLDEVQRRLEELRASLASGDHAGLEALVEESLEKCQLALSGLIEAVRQGQVPPGAREGCLEIRRLAALVRELIRHAEQVRSGLASIASVQYSPDGTPRLEAAPRLLAEA